MELNHFISKFAEQFEDTDISNFKADTDFRKLEEWSSLIALNIILMVDEEYSIEIKGEDIRDSVTIEDLYLKVKNKA